MTEVITRFAPSPTGYLHIGGARTALFNWLYAKKHGGKYLLRIEDTDRARSTKEAEQAIFEGLEWLGLLPDEEPVYQHKQLARHMEVAKQLVEKGHAYYCYTTAEELAAQREEAKANKQPPRYNRYWRDRDVSEAPKDVQPSIRLKMPLEGETVIEDQVQGTVRVQNKELEDFVIVRSDGTPTYMLSVVVDDHDMGVTHIIRGDDHLTNTFKQVYIYEAMGWSVPITAHVPLIHGADGAKLSKRHWAVGAISYKKMGFLPEAMCNYLLRLGWGHGDEEIISRERALDLFDLGGLGKAPARFDVQKLTSLNAHYMQECPNETLMEALLPFMPPLEDHEKARVHRGLNNLKVRAKTLIELAENASIYKDGCPEAYTEKAQKFIEDKPLLQALLDLLSPHSGWDESTLHALVKSWCETHDIKLGKAAQTLRSALTGTTVSPSVFEVAEILGKGETLHRLQKALEA